MSAENRSSLNFYKYMCQKIGYEDEVKIRRLTYIIDDLGKHTFNGQITSGSRGEGLNLNGSDLDIMYIDSVFKVYESERDVVPQSGRCICLVMDTDDTHPCFTQLRLGNIHNLTFISEQILKNIFMGRKASSELYRRYRMRQLSNKSGNLCYSINVKIHGPCISDSGETHDFACCLKCDKWISQAKPWIVRSRTTWPSPDLISKIISCGVLYVPIGYKGSINENLQWRISFSVAEKILIFSFNHVQFLCYALLKILVKEIVGKHEDLNTLLCSYFLKTLMFWILKESEPSMWRPDKIIPCFMACLKRLIYCVEYSTLLHYFIPDNNLFYLRFDRVKKDKMTRIMNNLFEKGIYCFAQSETLNDMMRLYVNAASIARCVLSLYEMTNAVHGPPPQSVKRLYHFLHKSSTKTSRSIFFVMLSLAHQKVPQISQNQPRSSNKHKYYKYKQDRSHMMIGINSDAVTGWLLLASFLYVHENYLLSLDITNHALRKCTDEKVYPSQIGLDQNQLNLLHLLKRAELCTLSKLFTVRNPQFIEVSKISPQEFKLKKGEQVFPFHPMIFAHFLSFLCYHHLHNIRSRNQCLFQVLSIIVQHITSGRWRPMSHSLSFICLGICSQIMGETDWARNGFFIVTQFDELNLTSASIRLSNLDQI
ncbi:Hypothetical predicted protein [Mytilus galloprovincialis]|uniref:Mab-21-like HhH/H2TH-like domain-containing protein n=1 Tax=Mytilus galloprovincialis TaxID=29158 RepID=A0A8B6DSI5_MYTGA|nr:Hypothetical predicted protein [Mytilus galloprovincialis]